MPTKHGVVPAPTNFCVMNRIFFYSAWSENLFKAQIDLTPTPIHVNSAQAIYLLTGVRALYMMGVSIIPIKMGTTQARASQAQTIQTNE